MSGDARGAASGWLRRGGRLPFVALKNASGGEMNLRSGRGPRVLFASHSAACDGCAAYVRQLMASAEGFHEWDARVLLVEPEPVAQSSRPASDDPAGFLRLADGGSAIATGAAAVAVADEWGEVYFAHDAAEGHDLPAAAELIEWLRFVGIQCPECEGPEGGWRTL